MQTRKFTLNVFACVDVYVNLLFSYNNYNIYTDLTEKVRGRDGNKRGKVGKVLRNGGKKAIFLFVLHNYVKRDSGVREDQISYHRPLEVHLHPLVCQRSRV